MKLKVFFRILIIMDGILKLQIIVFILCFLSSLTRHSLVESWSILKPQISDGLDFSNFILGLIDMLFLFCYAAGNITLGHLADKYNPKKILSYSMIIAAIFYVFILFMALALFKSPALYAICTIFNGFFQGAIWPCCISIMGNWYSAENRGKIMGLWIINTSIGNIFGSQAGSGMVSGGVEWQLILITFVYFFVFSTYLNILLLKDKPEGHIESHERLKHVSIIYALKIQGVINYSIIFACVKMVHYSFILWLPSYIYKQLNESEYEGGALASLYDVGGLIGCILVGWISDKVSNRVYIFFPLLIGSLPLILSFTLGSKNSIWIFYILIPIVGLIMSGVSNLICSAVAADLGQKKNDEYDSKTTIVGIIEASGGVGAGIGQIIIGKIVGEDWNNVFYLAFGITLFACFAMVPIVVRSVRSQKNDEVEI